jgi:hypothetical protein
VDQLLQHRLQRQDVLKHHAATQEAVEVKVDAGRTDLFAVNLFNKQKDNFLIDLRRQA